MNIERRLGKLGGVESANVNYATGRATVEYDEGRVGAGNFKEAIEGLGYRADIPEEASRKGSDRMLLHISGMDCPDCAMAIDKALRKEKGILRAEIDFNLERGVIDYDKGKTDFGLIRRAIKDAGFDAELMEMGEEVDKERAAREKETGGLKARLAYSALLTVPIVLLALPEMLGSLAVNGYPEFLMDNMALLQFLLTTPVLLLNRDFFIRGARGLISMMPGMDTLVALGVGTAFAYSALVGFGFVQGKMYYETSALLLTFIVLGKYLEAVAKGKTSEAIKRLVGLSPRTAIVIMGGTEEEIPIKDVAVGDVVVVRPGGKVSR